MTTITPASEPPPNEEYSTWLHPISCNGSVSLTVPHPSFTINSRLLPSRSMGQPGFYRTGTVSFYISTRLVGVNGQAPTSATQKGNSLKHYRPPSVIGFSPFTRRLGRSLDKLCNIFYGEEYKRCVGELRNDDLMSLVDYLDKVRHRITPRLYLNLRRLSILSTLPVSLSGNAYGNSEIYVAPGRFSRPRTLFRPQLSISIISLSPREVLGTSSKGPSTDQRFASNVLGYTPRAALMKP